MKTTNNTVLITGGGSGIGFETAKLLDANGNKTILIGRDGEKLERAASQLDNAVYIVCDITDEKQVGDLIVRVNRNFSDLNILINNAGKAFAYPLSDKSDAFSKAQEEILTNYLSSVRLIEGLLPLLSRQPEAAIINNSSITAFAPATMLPTYSASKAALHSYTQALRLTLQKSTVKVFEVMPPLVDTEFSKALPGRKIAPQLVAQEILNGLEKNIYEIHVDATASFYKLYLASPQQALYSLNGING